MRHVSSALVIRDYMTTRWTKDNETVWTIWETAFLSLKICKNAWTFCFYHDFWTCFPHASQFG